MKVRTSRWSALPAAPSNSLRKSLSSARSSHNELLAGLNAPVFCIGRLASAPAPSSKGRLMMKGALTGIASVGILVVTVGVETANAQSYRRYGPARTYTPQAHPSQSRGSIPRGVPRTVPFSDPNSPEATGGGNIGYNRGLPDGGY